jgi:murein L,D-transpeptidase YafK
MTLYRGDKVLAKYKVALGRGPKGPKERQGDHKTPEGQYFIDSKNAHSRFQLALHISYPNARDRSRAALERVNPGGDVEIHGLPSAFAFFGSFQSFIDWTDGCIAVSDAEIEEIWKLVPVGTKVEILP